MPFHIYAQDSIQNFGKFGVEMIEKAGLVYFKEGLRNKLLFTKKGGETLQQCFASVSPLKLDSSVPALRQFMKDVCAISRLRVSKSNKPVFLAFYVSSLTEVAGHVDQAQLEKLRNTLESVIETQVEQVQKEETSTSAQIFKVPQNHVQTETLLLANRRLGTNPEPSPYWNANNYQIYVWTAVIMAFVLFYGCYSLFNMEIIKDTLVYAPFIANEGK